MLTMAMFSERWSPGSSEILDLVSLFAVGRLVDAAGPINRNHRFVFDFDSSPLPPDINTDLDFAQICDRVAQDIWRRAQNQTVALWWSGGIDSTAALVALMRTNPRWAQQLKIYTSKNAIDVEYPWFYQQYLQDTDCQLLHGWNLWSQELFDPDFFLLDGNCGDQLWGSMRLVDLQIDSGSAWRRLFDLEFFHDRIGPGHRDCVADYITDQVAKFPAPVHSIADIFWWMNFTHKYDYIKHIAAVRTRNPSLIGRMCCFFDNWDFQRWSMCNPQSRRYSRWEQYKQPAKDYIWDYTGDSHYRDNKIKVPSPPVSVEYDGIHGPTPGLEIVTKIDGQISDQLYLRQD